MTTSIQEAFKLALAEKAQDAVASAKSSYKLGVVAEDDAVVSEETYKEFFTKALKKFGVTEPDQLEGDKKKEFFDYVDANWEGEKESD